MNERSCLGNATLRICTAFHTLSKKHEGVVTFPFNFKTEITKLVVQKKQKQIKSAQSYLYRLCPPALHTGTHGSLVATQTFREAVGAPAGERVCTVGVPILL